MKHKYHKHLRTNRGEGELPQLIIAQNENLESRFVVSKVLELREQGIPLREIAILFRSSFFSFDLEIELTKANIPFVKFGGFKFIETAHIKDLIAYLRVLENPRDVVAWNRILLLINGVGPRTAEKVIDDILSQKMSFNSPAFWMEYHNYPGNVRELFDVFKSIYSERYPPDDKAERIISYYYPLFKSSYDDYTKRKKDLEMFVQIAGRYKDINTLLTDLVLEPPNESISEVVPVEKEDEYLTLSTIHSAKGLEWHSVFIICALDGRFPSLRAEGNPDELEEERRLMYVACTRAKENLYISYPINIFDRETGLVLSKPSRFLEGLNENILEPWIIDED